MRRLVLLRTLWPLFLLSLSYIWKDVCFSCWLSFCHAVPIQPSNQVLRSAAEHGPGDHPCQ